jgi:GGDEF domain-containing protein
VPTADQKIVKVGDDVIAFPGDLEDAHVAKLIQSFRTEKNKVPNAQYAKQGPYKTDLAPDKETAFQTWVKTNNVPWQDTPNADYDMRGYWQAMVAGNAKQSKNQNDGKMHFPDTWKTPYHKSFSNESQYALPNAPKWNDKDQLIDSTGKVVFDERAAQQAIKPKMPLATEASEHARQLKPAQPLSSAIPSLPDWANKPLVSDKELEETPQGQALTAKSQAQFSAAHPKVEAALEKGNTPAVLGTLQGVNDFTKGMQTPANMALMLGAPESKILSGIFATQAMRGSFRDAKAAKAAFDAGNNQEAMSYVTQALLGAGIAGVAGAHAYGGLPEGVRSRLASEEGSVGPQEGGAERRSNPELRKRIDEMTPEEMRKILKTSDVVDLPNKRSFQEDQHFTPAPFVARSDADGLKAFNDKFGYDKGDELLRAKAEALKEAGLNAYHEKGDEFLYRGANQKELEGRLEKAREILRNRVFDVTLDDGTHVQLKGVDFSYGTGKDLKEAEQKQHAHKQEREAKGQRARGELRGLVEVGTEAGGQGAGAAQGGAAPTVAEVKKQAAELKPTTAYKTVDQSQPFYLKSENLINEKMKGPMAAEDVHKMLLSNGVKPEEMQWTGLDEFLKEKGNKKVTPQEIQEHLAGNNLQLQEVAKGVGFGPKPTVEQENAILDWVKQHEPDSYKDSVEAMQELKNGDVARVGDFEMLGVPHELTAPFAAHVGGESHVKYGHWQMPGGSNYRELLMTMPDDRAPSYGPRITELPAGYKVIQDADLTAAPQWGELGQPRQSWHVEGPDRLPIGLADSKEDAVRFALEDLNYKRRREAEQKMAHDKTSFRTNHWEEPNVLGHIRFNDRKGPNGEKILHIEELQSDWHQKGRKTRYVDPNKPFGIPVVGVGQFATRAEAEAAADKFNVPHGLIRDERTSDRPEGAVPDAPFKKTWPELMLKRMIKYAADHGYDGISWTPGEEQAERYDLSKHVSRITYAPVDGTLRGYDLNGGQVITENATPEELPNYIGKDAAQKLVEKSEQYEKAKEDAFNGKPFEVMRNGKMHTVTVVPDRITHQGSVLEAHMVTDGTNRWYEPTRNIPPLPELSGVDLKVGGQGMKGFYDKIIPDVANKLGKQWGAKVGETKIEVPASLKEQKYVYEGPELTEENLDKLWDAARKHGPDNYINPITGKREMFPINRVANEGPLRKIRMLVDRGATIGDAISEEGSPGIAELFGGQWKPVVGSKTMAVPYLPIKPQTGPGIKSIPYSLFGVTGAALGLQAVKQKADELKAQFQKAGLSR